MPDTQPKTGQRTLMVYLLVLVFVCVCSVFAISQRLEIARKGKTISDLKFEAGKERFRQSYLNLEVAKRASYKNLIARAQEMKLDIIPPEDKSTKGEDDEE